MGMKKGFFFSIDGFMALMLFVVVLLSIYSYIIISKDMEQQYYFSEDLLDVFSNVKVNELDSGIYPSLEGYLNQDYTILEVLVVEDNLEDLNNTINDLVNGLISEQYDINLYIDGNLFFNDVGSSTSLVSREKLVYNHDTNEFSTVRLEVGLINA